MGDFWKATAIRALKTVCQTAVATIGTAVVLEDVNWIMVISASILAGVLSVLTSIGMGLPEVRSAGEATAEEVMSEPVAEYDDSEYDDLFVDDEVEE